MRALLVLLLCAVATAKEPATSTAPLDYPSPRTEDVEHNKRRTAEFLAFDPDYSKSMMQRVTRANLLGGQVYLREGWGQDVQLSHQTLSEIIWLIEDTADFKRID